MIFLLKQNLGGTFPIPPAVAHLNNLLPPPVYFHGPFVGVDKLMDVFQRLLLPDETTAPNGEGCDSTQFDLAKSVHWVVNPDQDNNTHHGHHNQNNRGGRRGTKRKMGGNQNQHDSDDDDSNAQPPLNDIYRVRQQSRVK